MLTSGTAMVVGPGADAGDAAGLLRESLRGVGIELADTDDTAAGDPAISFVGRRGLGPEAYRLEVLPDGVTVEAADRLGFLWAVETVRQLLPTAADASTVVALPAGVVDDAPRYGWRGTMLDVARHPFGVDDIEHVVDLAASIKLNRLHLHLPDDQGWRIEIRSHPELTDIGSRSEVGDGPGGMLTQADYRDIVAYAAGRGVTIVPEIDVPGHTNAALVSLPWLTCDGEAPDPYRGTDVGFSSVCVDDPRTLAWLDDVIGEIAAMTPGRWIHLGGDESRATDPVGYRRFIEQALDIVRAHGKTPIGWEEIGSADLTGGEVVAQHWVEPQRAIDAADQGASVVLSPANRAYFDMKYDESTPIGQVWAGFVTSRSVYDWDPARQLGGVPGEQILGVEAPLWTETVTSRSMVDAMLLPRLAAFAEVAWTPQARRDWSDAGPRLARQQGRWRSMGIASTDDPSLPH